MLLSIRAFVVSTSSTWINYRHSANAMAVYDMLRSNGVKPEEIVLALGYDPSWDSRNPYQGKIFHDRPFEYSIMVPANLTGNDVTITNFRKKLL